VLAKGIELAPLHRNGEFPVALSISPPRLRGESAFNAFLDDVSERKRAGQAQAYLAAIIDSSDDAIIGKDLDGTIKSWNRGAETIYGYSADEVVGLSMSILIPPHQVDEVPGMLERIKRGEKIHNYENARVRKDGTSIDVSLTMSPVKDAAGRVIGAATIARDISELKQARQEAERLKEEFFALVSHDLRTPLASVKGYSNLLLTGKGGDLTDQQRLFLEAIARNTTRLERLVGDLLFAAEVEAGTFAIDMGPVDLRRVLTDSVDAAKPGAEEKEIELTLEAGSIPECSGDGDRLAQLFDNLISNAIKYTPEGGRVAVRLQGENGHVLIEIEDSGIGIPMAEQEFLFDRFFRASTANSASIPGIGLGLTISKAITEAHRDQLGVKSEEGVGTTFQVELPLGDNTPRAEVPQMPASASSAARSPERTAPSM
jgi:PAS domain S-box-containing protein